MLKANYLRYIQNTETIQNSTRIKKKPTKNNWKIKKRDIKKQFREDIQMANKHKQCLLSSSISEIQFKIKREYCYTSIRMAKIKELQHQTLTGM